MLDPYFQQLVYYGFSPKKHLIRGNYLIEMKHKSINFGSLIRSTLR